MVISASADHSVDVWDLATRRLLYDSYVGHTAPVRAIATGELNGHPVVIFGGKDARLQVWDLLKRRPMRSALRTVHLQHSAPVLAAVAHQNQDHLRVLASCSDGTIWTWTFRAVVCFQRNDPRAEQWSQPSHFCELESEMLALTTYGSSTVVAATASASSFSISRRWADLVVSPLLNRIPWASITISRHVSHPYSRSQVRG